MASEEVEIQTDFFKKMESPSPPVPDDRVERIASAEPFLTHLDSSPTELPSHSPLKMHLDLEHKIKRVLDSRPSIRMASRPALSPVTDGGSLSRGSYQRRTLPANLKSASLMSFRRKTHRKFSSFSLKITENTVSSREKTVQNKSNDPTTHIVLQDLEDQETAEDEREGEEEETGVEIERNDELRKSTAHLRQRLIQHRQTLDLLEEERAVQPGCCADLRYVKWPKLKSRLQVLLSYKLWKSHLKEVEGHFGTAVVSYFIFLRWLFIMNLLIFALWFGVIVIPQIIHLGSRSLNSTSHVSCVFEMSSTNNVSCAASSTVNVFGIRSNCTYEDNTFTVQTCSFDNDGIATSESGNEVTVSLTDCTFSNEATTRYVLCPNVDPHFEWYTYVVDFISGTGIFNETVMFQGVYADFSSGRFSFDLAFLVMVAIIYTVSVILLVYKMGYAFNESYVQFGKKRKVNFCNKLFTAWDFNITHPKTAKLKQAHIKTDFQEELVDTLAREKERTVKELILVIFIRIGTNLFVLLSLVGAGAAIYYSAVFELQLATEEDTTVPIIGEYISAIVISVLNAVYPFVFQFIARIEKYKTASGGVTITLIRTILVRLSSLLVLLSSLYNVISSCTVEVDESEDGECEFAQLTGNILANETDDSTTCPECWETFIGQQFFKLALTNLLVALGATIAVETGRNFVSYLTVKIKYKNLGSYLSKLVTRGNFNIPKSILDLIYTQSLLWLGFLFSPLLPFIVLLTSFFLFYIKKYSLLYNLDPDKKGFARTARTNFMFLFLMLLALFASAVPVLYAVTQLKPSENCGPFRGQDTMYQSITLLIMSWSCTARIAVSYFGSAAFVVPLIIFLLLLLYAMYVILKARDARFQLIKKQLILEGANVTHIVGHLDAVLLQLAEERTKQELKRYSQNPQYLEEAVKRYSSSHRNEALSTATIDTTVF